MINLYLENGYANKHEVLEGWIELEGNIIYQCVNGDNDVIRVPIIKIIEKKFLYVDIYHDFKVYDKIKIVEDK
jgi:hypothetical protein